jgi:hypothetical protein
MAFSFMPQDNVMQQFSAPADPSYMQPSAPRQTNVMQMMQPPAQAPEPPRKRTSVLDIIGGIADTFAEMGGATPMYQRNVDARTKRDRETELYPIQKTGFELDNTKTRTDIADKRTEMMGAMAIGALDYMKKGGKIETILPVMYQQLGLTPEEIALYHQQIMADPEGAMTALAMFGKSESAKRGLTPFYGMDKDKNLIAYQTLESGGAEPINLGEGIIPIPPTTELNLGDRSLIVGRSGNTVREESVSGTPASGDIPVRDAEGNPTGQVTQAPGSQAALEEERKRLEQREKDEKREAQFNRQKADAALVRNTVKTARDTVSNSVTATGLAGQGMQYFGGTDARNLQNFVDTIKSRISIDNLMEMRANSPTGGALGNVSNADIALLANALASLDITQSKDVFLNNLKIIDDFYSKVEAGTAAGQRKPKTASDGGWKLLGPVE